MRDHDPQAIPALLVEAFTTVPCQGNAAAVVLLRHAVSDRWMQDLARSLNQSETAFLLRSQGGWFLRWFTPTCEVRLCGHATLAALLALNHWQQLGPQGTTTFFSRSGPLPVSLTGDLASLCLPSTVLVPEAAPDYLSALVQSEPQGFWRSRMGYSVMLLDPTVPLERLPSPARHLATAEASGLVLMQPWPATAVAPQIGGCRADYQLRFFAPGLGIDEDPVTGSAHALVGPLWLDRLGQSRVVGWQCSSRPGGMAVEAASSGMIRLSGTGVLLWCGSLQLQHEPCGDAAAAWQACCAPG